MNNYLDKQSQLALEEFSVNFFNEVYRLQESLNSENPFFPSESRGLIPDMEFKLFNASLREIKVFFCGKDERYKKLRENLNEVYEESIQLISISIAAAIDIESAIVVKAVSAILKSIANMTRINICKYIVVD